MAFCETFPHRGSDLLTIAASMAHSVTMAQLTPRDGIAHRWKNGLRAQVGDDIGEILITKWPGSVRDHSN
jgi:hypothetical protein